MSRYLRLILQLIFMIIPIKLARAMLLKILRMAISNRTRLFIKNAVTFSSDGKFFTGGNGLWRYGGDFTPHHDYYAFPESGLVGIFSSSDSKNISSPLGVDEYLNSLVFSQKDDLLIAPANTRLMIWNVDDGKYLTEISTEHDSMITNASISEDWYAPCDWRLQWKYNLVGITLITS